MAVPTFIQSNTAASDGSANTTHQITLAAIRSQGGAIAPSTICVGIVYDNGTGGIGTSVADNIGSTYTKIINRPDAVNGFTLEVWEAHNVIGGAAPTITWTGSASVKAKLGAVEMDQVAPVSPIDGTSTPVEQTTDRVDITSSTSRTSAATNTTKRKGQIQVFVGWIGWNDTRTISAAGSTWTGLVQLSGGSSNLGIGIERKNLEVKNISGTNNIARFTMSASSVTPAAVASLAFYRAGVQTSATTGSVVNEDGYIDNIEGVEAIVTAFSPDFVYMSSASAPNGGTGGSEKTNAFAFFPRFYPLSGVTIGEDMTLFYTVSDGFDEGNGYFSFYYHFWKDGELGDTLTSGDSNSSNQLGGWDRQVNLGSATPTTTGEQSIAMVKSTDWNPTGTTNGAMSQEGDGNGSSTSTYTNIVEYAGNIPQYIVLQEDYPVLSALKDPILTGGVIPFLR